MSNTLGINARYVDAHLNLGVLLMNSGDLAGAGKEFRSSLEADPNFAEAHYNLGLAMAAQQNWLKAGESLRAAIALNPGNAYAHWSLGRVLRDNGDTAGARGASARAWKLDRSLVQAAVEYGKLLPGRQAREVWHEALQHNPLDRDLQSAYLSVLESESEVQSSRVHFALLNDSEFRTGLDQLNHGGFSAAAHTF